MNNLNSSRARGNECHQFLCLLLFVFFALNSPASTTFNVTNGYALAFNTSFAKTNAAGKFVFDTNALCPVSNHITLTSTGTWAAVAFGNTNAGAFTYGVWITTLSNTAGANVSRMLSNRFQISAAQMAGSFGSSTVSNGTSGGAPTIGTVTNTAGSSTNVPDALPEPVVVYAGTNTPEGIYTAGRGSIYNRFDVATGTNFQSQWIKRTSTGNTGWLVNTNVAGSTGTNGLSVNTNTFVWPAADYATTSGSAGYANSAGTANTADSASTAQTASSATFATTANTATNIADGIFQSGGRPLVLDMQASGARLSGELWGAMPKPWLFIYGGIGTNVWGTNCTAMVNNLVTNGELATITNMGVQPCFFMDCNFVGTRNTNWTHIMRNFGTLTWDTNRFPDGVPEFIAMCHTNGVKVVAQIYAVTNLTPTGATEWLFSEKLGNLQTWTNGTGTFPSDSYGNYCIVSTPDYAQGDMQELMLWGFDGVVLSDTYPSLPEIKQMSYCWGRALLQTCLPYGFKRNTSYLPIKYADIDTNITTGTYSGIFAGQYYAGDPTTYVLGRSRPAAFIAFETTGDDQRFTAGYISRYNHTGVFYDNSSQGNGATGLRSLMRDFPGQKKANEGGYVVWMWLNTQASYMAIALAHQLPFGNYRQNDDMPPDWANAMAALTNTPSWVRIWNDPDQNWFQLIQDYGTNVGSVWATKLFDGSYGVGFFSEGTATNLTVAWTNLGWPSDLQVRVQDAYYSQHYVVTATNQDHFTFAANGSNNRLVLLEPLTPIQSLGSSTNMAHYGDVNATNWTVTSPGGWLNTNVNGGNVRVQQGNVTASGTFTGSASGLTNNPFVYYCRSATNVPGSTNTAAFVVTNTSFQVALPSGVYKYDILIRAQTASSSSGININVPIIAGDVGTGICGRTHDGAGWDYIVASSGAYLVTVIGNDAGTLTATAFGQGFLTVAAGKTNIYCASCYARTAADALNYPNISTNSYMFFEKVQSPSP
jgi:hypothetical protein